MVYTKEDLKKMQAWTLAKKIQVTQTRIIEYYQHYGGKVYVSFSGGKDSTVLLDIARKIYSDIEGVFIDTGLEYPEIREFVKTFDNIKWIKPKMRFDEVIREYGYPIISKEVSDNIYRARKGSQNAIDRMNGYNPDGTLSSFKIPNIKYKYLLTAPFKISNKCCKIIKKDPIGKQPIMGTMASESTQRATGYKQSGCNSFDKKRGTSVPMGFWTDQDVLQYIQKYGLKISEVYGEIIKKDNHKAGCSFLATAGADRTGCMFCGFGCHLEKEPNRFQRIKQLYPKQYEYIMKPIEECGLGFKQVLDFINVKTE